MAIITDDCDLNDVRFYMTLRGNGDYYITLIEYPMPESSSGSLTLKIINYRMAMSGGFTHRYPEVREAFVKLYRVMEKAGLNNYPNDDKIVESRMDSTN